MRARALLLLAALAVPQSAGCCRSCPCCGERDRILPRRDTRKLEDPPLESPPRTGEAAPAANPNPTGAYGGS